MQYTEPDFTAFATEADRKVSKFQLCRHFSYPLSARIRTTRLLPARDHLNKGDVSWEYTHPLRWRNVFLHRGAKIDSPLA